jgi:SAM-dependent methyltransferase
VKHVFLADAQDLRLPDDMSWEAGRFDAVFSNATLHWCKRNPLGVLTGIQKVLKPGGRLALEMGGFTNCIGSLFETASKRQPSFGVTGIRSTIHSVLRSKGHNPEALDPWYFPTGEEYSKVNSLWSILGRPLAHYRMQAPGKRRVRYSPDVTDTTHDTVRFWNL